MERRRRPVRGAPQRRRVTESNGRSGIGRKPSADDDKFLALGCISPILGSTHGRRSPYCARGGNVSQSGLLAGRQPLCRQHREIAEDALQRIMLGQSALVLPERAEMGDWEDDQLRCGPG